MTTVNWTLDERSSYTTWTGATIKAGRFRSRVSSGGNRVAGESSDLHPYVATHVDYFSQPYTEYVRSACNVNFTERLTGVCTGAVSGPVWTTNDELKLLGKLREEMDGHDFNTPVFVGELGKATDNLASRARQLGRAALAAKRGNLLEAARGLGLSGSASDRRMKSGQRSLDKARGRGVGGASGNAHPDNIRDDRLYGDLPLADKQRMSDAWLELQYGFKPLVSDISNLADLIQGLDTKRGRRIFARRALPRVAQGALVTSLNGCGDENIAVYDSTSQAKYRKQIIAYLEEPVPTWPERLGLTDTVSVAWELLPWSFVADWFIPVGDWLSARMFARRAVGRFVTTVYEFHTIRGSGVLNPCYEPAVYQGCVRRSFKDLPGIWWSRKFYVNRTISTSLSVPMPTWTVPFDGPSTRLANAAALIASAFSRR